MENLERNSIIALITMERNYNRYIDYLRNNREFLEKLIKLSKMKELVSEDEYAKDYYSVLDSISIAKDFLNSISPIYAREFEEAIRNGSIETANEYENFEGYSYLETATDNKFNVHIELEYTIEDVFTFVHEYFHMSNEKFNDNEDRYLYTELISILGEFLLFEYLKNNNISPEDAKNAIKRRLNTAYFDGSRLSAMYDIYDNVIANINKLHEKSVTLSEEELEESINKATGQVRNVTRYFIGTMLSLLKYSDYCVGVFDKDDFIYLNELVSRRNDTESISHTFVSLDEEYMEESIKKSLKNFA